MDEGVPRRWHGDQCRAAGGDRSRSVGASIDGSHIAYTADISYADILIGLYIIATCGACLVASNTWLVLLGLANLSAVIALGWITFTGFTSLWCAWAALTSIAIAIYLRAVVVQSNHPLLRLRVRASVERRVRWLRQLLADSLTRQRCEPVPGRLQLRYENGDRRDRFASRHPAAVVKQHHHPVMERSHHA